MEKRKLLPEGNCPFCDLTRGLRVPPSLSSEARKWFEEEHANGHTEFFVLLQALSDREAEIVAGIEGMKKSDAIYELAVVYFYNAALKDIATKITKGEI